MAIEEHLTIPSTGNGSPEASPPESLENVLEYKEFFTEPKLFQRALIHLKDVRPLEGSTESLKAYSYLAIAEAYGENTGSAKYFNIGRHQFAGVDSTTPIFDEMGEIYFKKGSANTQGIKLSLYHGNEDVRQMIVECEMLLNELPMPSNEWKEFKVSAEETAFVGLELTFRVKVNDGIDKGISQSDIMNFCKSTATVEYSEQIITPKEAKIEGRKWRKEKKTKEELEKEANEDQAVLQCWRHKNKSSKAIIWFPGRNDCFMHPHVAKSLFVNNGYDFFVLNYSCVGLCRQRGWLRSAHFNSHNRKGDFDVYNDQIDAAISIIGSHQDYDTVIGYAHCIGASILINYLMDRSDDIFDGFIFNSPTLEWTQTGSKWLNEIVEDSYYYLQKLKVLSPDRKIPKILKKPHGLEKTSIEYLKEQIFIDTDAAKLWGNYFFDFRARPLYPVPLTLGFITGMTSVQEKIRQSDEKVSGKPSLCITSKGSNTSLGFMDELGLANTKIDLHLNGDDVFLSLDKKQNDMALAMTGAWMVMNGFQ